MIICGGIIGIVLIYKRKKSKLYIQIPEVEEYDKAIETKNLSKSMKIQKSEPNLEYGNINLELTKNRSKVRPSYDDTNYDTGTKKETTSYGQSKDASLIFSDSNHN